MEYLPGAALDYRRDLEAAARLFARIHAQPVAPEDNHLIREKHPLSMTCDECARLLELYLESDLADPALRDYLQEVLDWAGEARYPPAAATFTSQPSHPAASRLRCASSPHRPSRTDGGRLP